MTIRPIPSADSEFDFLVESVPQYVQMPDGKFEPSGYFANRRADNLQLLGSVTQRYEILQNIDLVTEAEIVFHKLGMDFVRQIVVPGNCKKMFAVYEFPGFTKILGREDEANLAVVLQNSFDGSLKASVSCGAIRQICSNGLVTLKKEVFIAYRHTKSLQTEVIEHAIKAALSNWSSSFSIFSFLSSVEISQAQGSLLIGGFTKAGYLSAANTAAVQHNWDFPIYDQDRNRNLFSLYNAATQHLSHSVAPTYFELAMRSSRKILEYLGSAGANLDAAIAKTSAN